MKKSAKKERSVFPKGFLWGAATSAHQVEGNNIHNDWWAWEQKGGGRESSGVACDHFNRYEQDFTLAKKLNHNAHRLSIEWSRIEPEEGKWNQKAIEHYQKVLESLKDKGMRTFVSLFHVTLPQWFAKRGGFERKENIEYFKRFSLLVASSFADKVDFWITVNEPKTVCFTAYFLGIWPPQSKNKLLALRVYRNLALAHKEVYRALKSEFPDARVGAVINMLAFHCYRSSFLRKFVLPFVKLLSNRSFYLLTGKTHDFLGVNYYFFHDIQIKDLMAKITKKKIEQTMLLERSDLGWPIYPQGIYEVLADLKKYKLPIYITENGVADAQDKFRAKFILNHLQWVHRAIRDGVDVRGYLHWSLMDNFEWAFGFKLRFGLIGVDYKTQRRKIRESAKVYAQIAKENALVL